MRVVDSSIFPSLTPSWWSFWRSFWNESCRLHHHDDFVESFSHVDDVFWDEEHEILVRYFHNDYFRFLFKWSVGCIRGALNSHHHYEMMRFGWMERDVMDWKEKWRKGSKTDSMDPDWMDAEIWDAGFFFEMMTMMLLLLIMKCWREEKLRFKITTMMLLQFQVH